MHVSRKGKLNSKDTLCPVHRSYFACETWRDGARMQRVSKVGKGNMHKGMWIWFMPSIRSHRKPLTIFLTYLAFSCIFALHLLSSQVRRGLLLFILTAPQLPSAFYSGFFSLTRTSLKTIRQVPPTAIECGYKRNSDIRFRNNEYNYSKLKDSQSWNLIIPKQTLENQFKSS